MWAEHKPLLLDALNRLQDCWHAMRLLLGSDATSVRGENLDSLRTRGGKSQSSALLVHPQRALGIKMLHQAL